MEKFKDTRRKTADTRRARKARNRKIALLVCLACLLLIIGAEILIVHVWNKNRQPENKAAVNEEMNREETVPQDQTGNAEIDSQGSSLDLAEALENLQWLLKEAEDVDTSASSEEAASLFAQRCREAEELIEGGNYTQEDLETAGANLLLAQQALQES